MGCKLQYGGLKFNFLTVAEKTDLQTAGICKAEIAMTVRSVAYFGDEVDPALEQSCVPIIHIIYLDVKPALDGGKSIAFLYFNHALLVGAMKYGSAISCATIPMAKNFEL